MHPLKVREITGIFLPKFTSLRVHENRVRGGYSLRQSVPESHVITYHTQFYVVMSIVVRHFIW